MAQFINSYPFIFPALTLLLCVLFVVFLLVAKRRQIEHENALSLVQTKTEELTAANLALVKLEQLGEQLIDEKTKGLAAVSRADKLQQALSDTNAVLAGVNATLEEERKSSSEKLKLLESAKNNLTKEFENLANRIFDEKSEKFTKLNKSTVDLTVNPLREQIKEFKERVEFVYDKESKDRQSLLSEIGHLKNLNNQISQDAINLTKALKGESKTQGNWGEVVLERVLHDSGLRKDHEYDTQVSLKDAEGKRRAPDVVVHLPEEKDIVIDSKVSLLAYEKYCSSEDDSERKVFLKDHVSSVKKHIDDLSSKSYEDLEGVRTLDFVLLFIPIEAAFLVAFEQEGGLFSDAYEKNIIVVSPTTLLATLRTVQSIWRYERHNKNSEEIAAQAGKLHDQIALIAESIEDVGKHLVKADKAQEQAINRLNSGKGNLVNRAVTLEKLGAKISADKAKVIKRLSNDEELE